MTTNLIQIWTEFWEFIILIVGSIGGLFTYFKKRETSTNLLYKQLEDLWNYRLGLSNEYKRILCPPLGLAFTTPVIEVINYSHKEDIQELILHNVSKFINCETDTDRKMGFLYFIIALGNVSPQCWQAHHQILSVI